MIRLIAKSSGTRFNTPWIMRISSADSWMTQWFPPIMDSVSDASNPLRQQDATGCSAIQSMALKQWRSCSHWSRRQKRMARILTTTLNTCLRYCPVKRPVKEMLSWMIVCHGQKNIGLMRRRKEKKPCDSSLTRNLQKGRERPRGRISARDVLNRIYYKKGIPIL